MASNHLISVASIQHSRIKNIYNQNLERFTLVASRTQLRISLQKYQLNNDSTHIIKINKILKDALNSISSFQSISIYDISGNIITSTSQEILSLSQNYTIPKNNSSNTNISTEFNYKSNDTTYIILTGSLKLNNITIGTMRIETDITSLSHAISDYSGLGKSGEIILAKKESDSSIIFLLPTRFNSLSSFRPKIRTNNEPTPVSFSFSEQSKIITNLKDYRNTSVWAVTQFIKEANWGLVVKIDKREALEPLKNLRNSIFIMSSIFVILLILLFILFFKNLIKPITNLTEIATTISNGKTPDIEIKIKSNDEVGILENAFKIMTSKLTNSNKELEMKVNELNFQITERKKTEDALKTSEIKFKKLFNQSPIGLALCKMDGQLISVNPKYAQIIGYNQDEVLKLTYWDITPKKYAKNEEIQLNLLNKYQKYGPYEKEYIHRDGHLVPVRLNGMIVSHNGEDFIWSSIEDISDLKKAKEQRNEFYEQLQQSQKMEAIGTLAGGIAHDFNNILGAIIGFADLALDDIDSKDLVEQDINQLLKASNRAKELVMQILTYSRKEITRKTSFNITKTIQEVIKLLRASTPSNIEINTNIENNCGNIYGNETQIHQVVLNIANNAIHAIEHSIGKLKISLQPIFITKNEIPPNTDVYPGHYICLEITDNGKGIKPELLDKIFDPYFTTKEVGKGSGLGLAVVSGIVKTHSGFIQINSKINSGTEFKVFLPKTEGTTETNTQNNNNHYKGTETILLIDDEVDLTIILQRILNNAGYSTITYNNSIEALNVFSSNPNDYDLIITDYTMPELTGEKLAEKILTIRPNIPIIICSGYNPQFDEDNAKEIGISAYLPKPVSKILLLETIRNVLDKYKM